MQHLFLSKQPECLSYNCKLVNFLTARGIMALSMTRFVHCSMRMLEMGLYFAFLYYVNYVVF